MAELERNLVGVGRYPALVVIDVNNAFTDPASPLGANADHVVEAIATLLAEFRRFGLPVFYTTVAYDNPAQARVFRAKLPALEYLRAGSEAVEIDPRIGSGRGRTGVGQALAQWFFRY